MGLNATSQPTPFGGENQASRMLRSDRQVQREDQRSGVDTTASNRTKQATKQVVGKRYREDEGGLAVRKKKATSQQGEDTKRLQPAEKKEIGAEKYTNFALKQATDFMQVSTTASLILKKAQEQPLRVYMQIGNRRGHCIQKGLPLRGQRTHTNAHNARALRTKMTA